MTVLSLTAHGVTYRIYESPGLGPADKTSLITRTVRTGVPHEAELLEHIYQQGFTGTAVDVGANVGNHTLWFAMICSLNVIAFEPVVHQELVDNVRLNRLEDRVQIEPVALGAIDSRATHFGRGRLRTGRNGQIPVRTLDSYQLNDISIIKIDVEGMESDVLRGGVETVERCRPVIYAEEWNFAAHLKIEAVLAPLEYRTSRTFTIPRSKGRTVDMAEWRHSS
jgi:FkbM family methyltransferase